MDVLIRASLLALVCAAGASDGAHELVTNSIRMAEAPAWLTRPRVERVTDRIQTELEWTIRRSEVLWYADQVRFEKAHSLGPWAMAVTRKRDGTIHLGPKVTDKSFDVTFAHELVHITLAQKYKDAVPAWLEEGLANHLARGEAVNYAWLARQPFPKDVRTLVHPYARAERSDVHYHYVASHALIEMIAKKCDLTNLLRLSVGEKMTTYLETYCEIKDLNQAFRDWVRRKAPASRP